jgi:opacity protein-like surface antigen
MKKFIKLSVISAMLCSSVAVAEDATQSVGLSAGTIGAELEYSRIIQPEYNLAVRVSIGGLSWDGDYDDTDTHYDTNVDLFNVGATLEYHPMSNGFYLAAGAFYHNDDFSMDATPSGGNYEFNGNEYLAALVGSVAGEVDGLNNFAPYIGIGYDASLFGSDNWFFTFKAGAWYQDSPRVNLTAHDCALDSVPGLPVGCDDLRYDLDQEEQDINDDIEDYKWWPVLHIGVSYRF